MQKQNYMITAEEVAENMGISLGYAYKLLRKLNKELADLQENRESLESYFTGKDMYDMWKKQTLEYYTVKPVTHKEIEELDFETRIRKRDELLAKKFSNNE